MFRISEKGINPYGRSYVLELAPKLSGISISGPMKVYNHKIFVCSLLNVLMFSFMTLEKLAKVNEPAGGL